MEEVPDWRGPVRFAVLGRLQIRLDDRLVELRRGKERTLLGLLLLHPGEVVPLDHLAAGLWEDIDLRPPATLRVHMSRLRASLAAALGPSAPTLIGDSRGYALEISPDAIDACAFERVVADGRAELRSGDAARAASTFRRALALWRGSVLEDLALSPAVEPEVVRLGEARLDALEDRIEADLLCGVDRDLPAELEHLVGEHPLRERLWGQRMLALYRNGRQADALRAYQALRHVLDEQLGIVPSPELRRLERAVLEQDPALEIGSLTAPQPALRVAPALDGGEGAMPRPARLITDDGLPFCGRQAQIDVVLDRLKTAAQGDIQLVLVSGEAGIGKTRLAAEVGRRARDRGTTVLYGRCDENLRVPFQPFLEALTQVARARPDQASFGRHAGELVRLAPELASLLPDLPPPLRTDPETERYRLFDAVAAWLRSVSAAEPTLLVIDDLHWAEQSTVLLLRHLVRTAEPVGVVVLATYRDAELGPSHPLTDLLADVGGDGRVAPLPLSGLDVAEVTEMISGVGGRDTDDTVEDLGRRLWSETVGNPLFVQEMIRSLVKSGVLREVAGVLGTSEPLTSIHIPDSVREVVQRRLARLRPATRTVLAVSSVTGVIIDFDAVVAASGLDEDAVLDALDEASAAALVRETPSGWYEFVHPLVRSALYAGMSSARRQQRHRQTAEALLRRPGSDPAAVSYHLRLGGEADPRIVDQSASAGDEALRRLAFAEAAGHFGRALAASSPTPRRRCQLLIKLGTAQRLAAVPSYRDSLLEASRLAVDLGDRGLLGRAVLANNRGFASVAGAIDAERMHYIEAALAATGSGDSVGRARLLAVQALESIWEDPELDRLPVVDESVTMARRLGDEACLLETWTAAHVAGSVPDRIPRLVDEAPALIELANRVGSVHQQAGTYAIAAIHYLQSGNAEESERLVEGIGRLAVEFNHLFLRWSHANHRCCHLTLTGTGNQIEAAALEALQLGQAAGQPDALTWFGPQLFAARWAQGRVAEMVGLIGQVVADSPGLPAWSAGLALAQISAGDEPAAIGIVEEVMARSDPIFPHNVAWLLSHSALAEAIAAVGTPQQAEREYELLRPYAGFVPALAMVARPAVSLWLAVLAALAGHDDRASVHFADALSEHRRLEAPVFLVRTQLEWGKFLLKTGESARAALILTQARDAAIGLGAAGIARAAAQLLPEDSP